MPQTPPVIAVLDDEPKLRQALQRLLTTHGFHVDTYEDGAAFFAALPSHPTNCLVLDLQMPVMTGLEVQARLAESDTQVPVVIITGHDSEETRDRALAGRPIAYLRKPVDDRALLDAIKLALIHNPTS